MELPNGMNYVLARCKKHNLVQHAEVLGILLCIPCCVQSAINTGEALRPIPEMERELHLESD